MTMLTVRIDATELDVEERRGLLQDLADEGWATHTLREKCLNEGAWEYDVDTDTMPSTSAETLQAAFEHVIAAADLAARVEVTG